MKILCAEWHEFRYSRTGTDRSSHAGLAPRHRSPRITILNPTFYLMFAVRDAVPFHFYTCSSHRGLRACPFPLVISSLRHKPRCMLQHPESSRKKKVLKRCEVPPGAQVNHNRKRFFVSAVQLECSSTVPSFPVCKSPTRWPARAIDSSGTTPAILIHHRCQRHSPGWLQ